MVQHAVDDITVHENSKTSPEDDDHKNIYSESKENDLYEIDNTILDEKKEKKEWRKRVFESEFENMYDIENQNGINRIHDNEVNKIAECNLLHDIINPYKRTKDRIFITLILYMDVWIRGRVEKSLRTFESYCIVYVVPWL